ncbi:hypothetical protein SLE2022_360350 [Rubroshorea leprosula]
MESELGQEQRSESAAAPYRPCLEDGRVDDNRNCSDSSGGVDLVTVRQCDKLREIDDSHLLGDAGVAAVRGDGGNSVEVGKVAERGTGKRRRGRPPRSQGKATALTIPLQRKKRDEEDVCFICFDGGSLVLCDRRGCPKAYHPTCIKRDEAFFRSKAKWNCGWHICISCQKDSHYMCYTCTYSLCKGCTKDADYLCVRGNKGFCGTCMKTVMLIENGALENNETVQVDFDDKSSWEYLFKVYWVYLKEKLSLSLDELTKAKNPWKGNAIMASKGESLNGTYGGNGKGSNMELYCGDLGGSTAKRRKTTKQQNLLDKEGSPVLENSSVVKKMPLSEGKSWATKELLEFVAHMKNGDTSMLSYADVQSLLLEYVAINNLRDPHQQCQIICDARLVNLFGKGALGHIEMLNLLESHFLIKDCSTTADTIRGGVTEAVSNQLIDGNHHNQLMMTNDKRRKTCKKVDERGQQTNLDEYAAIDVHNVTLIYLKRDLMEILIDDANKFHEKVVGSIVRIRIPGNDQNQDMHRLVQVVGTSKAAEPYQIGTRTTNLMLEILNLQKKEIVSIDGISNQDLSEDECRWLRQCIKCGLMKQLTVGDIQKKAMALQELRVNVWLESEILRLEHLRDRANEKGHRKELKECVEKLQLLNSPEERQHRVHEIPQVHADPNMKPSNLFTEDTGELDEKKKDTLERPNNFGFGTKEREPTSPLKGGDYLDDIRSQDNHSVSYSMGMEPSIGSVETDSIWHYQDPSGKIQGAFPLTVLRNWSASGRLAPDVQIWRVDGKQDDSILLTDALAGKYCKQTGLFENNSLSTQEVRITSADDKNGNSKGIGDVNVKQIESKRSEASWNSMENGRAAHCSGNNEFLRNNECGTESSPCATAAVNSNGGQNESPLPQRDIMKVDNHSPGEKHQVGSSLPSPPFSGQPFESQPHLSSQGHEVEGCVSGQSDVNGNLNKTSEEATVTAHGTKDGSEAKVGQSCGQSWIAPPVSQSSNEWGSDSRIISLVKALEAAAEENKENDFVDLPSSTTKSSHENSKGQATENKQSPSSNIPVQDSVPSWSTASSLVGGAPQLPNVAGEWDPYSHTSTKPSVDEWDSNLVPESSLKPTDLASDHAATPTSGSGQLADSSPTHLANISCWQQIVPEQVPDLALADESVSDLLAEVEAMESLNGLTSPTSILRCSGELTQGSEHECFSPVGGLSPAADPGKSDALSSTSDLQVPKSTVTSETFMVLQAEVLDTQKSSGAHSSTSAAMARNARPNISASQSAVPHLDVQPPAPPVTTWGMATRDTTWRSGSETTSASWETAHGNTNLNYRGLGQGSVDVDYGTSHVRVSETGSMNSGTYAGYRGNQSRHSGPRDRDFHVRDSGFNRGRPYWSGRQSFHPGANGVARQSFHPAANGVGRQSFHPGANGVGPYRAPPKRQRICKFYESGNCKRGESCSYWHP